MTDGFPIAKLAALTFMMMGPIGLIPTFAGLTAGADPALRRRIALGAFGYACVALAIAVGIGVGVLIVFVAYAPEPSVKGTILAIALAIMTLDLLAMLGAHALMRWIGTVPLTILGAVFGVLQVALGIEMIGSGIALRASGGG